MRVLLCTVCQRRLDEAAGGYDGPERLPCPHCGAVTRHYEELDLCPQCGGVIYPPAFPENRGLCDQCAHK